MTRRTEPTPVVGPMPIHAFDNTRRVVRVVAREDDARAVRVGFVGFDDRLGEFLIRATRHNDPARARVRLDPPFALV